MAAFSFEKCKILNGGLWLVSVSLVLSYVKKRKFSVKVFKCRVIGLFSSRLEQQLVKASVCSDLSHRWQNANLLMQKSLRLLGWMLFTDIKSPVSLVSTAWIRIFLFREIWKKFNGILFSLTSKNIPGLYEPGKKNILEFTSS